MLCLVLMVSGCVQVDYYLQAARGQYQIIAKREPVAELIASPDTSETLRVQLSLADRMRSFALQNMATVNLSGFTHYSDLGRSYAVWNVVAAPAYEMEPRRWCFPVAGCVDYKGFFSENSANEEAEGLRAEGYDVITYGVKAYSTLGWFADPLLNTFIHYGEPDLAAVIFHELAHQVIYVKDDSAFNEAFATAVEQALLTKWLQESGKPDQLHDLIERRRRHAAVTFMVLDFRDRLALAYQGPDRVSQKLALYAELKRTYQEITAAGEGTPYYDRWFQRPLNNADLLSVATYYHLVPAFGELLRRNGGELPAFFSAVRVLAEKPPEDRERSLLELIAE